MRKISMLISAVLVLLSIAACSLPGPLRANPSPTPERTLSTLPHKAASPTPTLAGRKIPPTPTEIPTVSPEQLKACMDALPADMPDTVKLMASGGAKDAGLRIVKVR